MNIISPSSLYRHYRITISIKVPFHILPAQVLRLSFVKQKQGYHQTLFAAHSIK